MALASIVPAGPANVGTFELTVVLIADGLGIPKDTAFAMGLLVHAMILLVTSIGGVVAGVRLGVWHAQLEASERIVAASPGLPASGRAAPQVSGAPAGDGGSAEVVGPDRLISRGPVVDGVRPWQPGRRRARTPEVDPGPRACDTRTNSSVYRSYISSIRRTASRCAGSPDADAGVRATVPEAERKAAASDDVGALEVVDEPGRACRFGVGRVIECRQALLVGADAANRPKDHEIPLAGRPAAPTR